MSTLSSFAAPGSGLEEGEAADMVGLGEVGLCLALAAAEGRGVPAGDEREVVGDL